ncbi:hypothetical protein [Oceanithermus sp.]
MKSRFWLWTLAVLALGACAPSGGGGGGVCELSGTIDTQLTLSPGSCSPYRVTGDLQISDSGRLVIEPGTTLEFAQDAGLTVSGHGALVAAGTASGKILFTGASRVRGYWKGLVFDAANSFDNELSYVEVEYAGADVRWDSGAYGNYRAALDVQSGSRLKMSNSIVRESAGSGLFVDTDVYFGSDATPDGDFAHNTITENASYPVIMYAPQAGFLDASNDFAGNDAGYDYVRVSGDYSYVATQTWQNLSVPYLIKGQAAVGADQVLTIAAGAHLVFEQDAGLEAYGHNSAIKAVGTGTDYVTFTGKQAVRGYWAGLHFNDTNNPENVLSYVIVEYGGNDTGFLDSDDYGNVVVSSSGNASSQRITISHSIIRHSGHWGVSVAQETSDSISDVTYSDNVDGDYRKRP